jgi:hypothetical protein
LKIKYIIEIHKRRKKKKYAKTLLQHYECSHESSKNAQKDKKKKEKAKTLQQISQKLARKQQDCSVAQKKKERSALKHCSKSPKASHETYLNAHQHKRTKKEGNRQNTQA